MTTKKERKRVQFVVIFGVVFLKERKHHALSGHGNESTRPWSGESEHVTHIHLTGLHPIRQIPREAVEKVSHRHLERVEPKLHPGAGPPTRPERNELEVAPLEVGHARFEEPGGPECFRILPGVRVPSDGPRVDHDAGPLGDEVAGDGGVLRRLVEEERDGRVEAEGLLQCASEVGEFLEVGLFDPAVQAHHLGQLLLDPPEVLWASHKLRHGPLDRRRHRLRPSKHHVL